MGVLQYINLVTLLGSFSPLLYINQDDIASISDSDVKCLNDTFILEVLMRKYSRHRATVVKSVITIEIEVWVQEITHISDVQQDFKIDAYMNEIWNDPSMQFADLNPCRRNITLKGPILSKVWKSNLSFINSKSAGIHFSPFENIWLFIFENGTIWANYRMNITGPCQMNFANFPLDVQKCHLTFESFTYNTDEVRMKWRQTAPITMLKEMILTAKQADSHTEPSGEKNSDQTRSLRTNLHLPDYTLMEIKSFGNVTEYPAGNWDELTMEFTFARRYGWYILQAYLPTYLSVFISWISFCLGSDAMASRTMLSVNALLALAFQFGSVMRNLPPVSYVKAIDVWMLSCMTFVFLSMVELAIVGWLHSTSGLNFSELSDPNDLLMTSSFSSTSTLVNRRRSVRNLSLIVLASWIPKNLSTVAKVDYVSTIIFPLFFSLFNLFYWFYFVQR